jgi:hypothetical protein
MTTPASIRDEKIVEDSIMKNCVNVALMLIITTMLTACSINNKAVAAAPETSLADFLKGEELAIGRKQDDATNHYSLRPVLDVYVIGCSIHLVIEKFENGIRLTELNLEANSVVQLGDLKQNILVTDSNGADYLIRAGSDESGAMIATKINQHKEKCENADEIFD